MKRKFVFCALALLSLQLTAKARILTVPSRTYPNIQTAINSANYGDEIVLEEGTYSGPGNINLDFASVHDLEITLRSNTNPANPDWNIINSTIINCGGLPFGGGAAGDGGAANRAFWFHSGEGTNIQIIGLRIINGYARGPRGASGISGFTGDAWLDVNIPWQTAPPFDNPPPNFEIDDPCELPPRALDGLPQSGDSYGGAILCQNDSSPSIQYCIFENNTATGAHGGRGADGLGGPWNFYTWADFNWADTNIPPGLLDDAEAEENLDGQWGGAGADGSGTGYGGAIACLSGSLSGSNPTIDHCIFRNNLAQGGRGGDGGTGGNGAYFPDYEDGEEGAGGNAGDSIGDGIGGAIYVALNCLPEITNCSFENNSAKTGPQAQGGARGEGNIGDPRAPVGNPGQVSPFQPTSIAGGAIYYDTDVYSSGVTNCEFVGNNAYSSMGNYTLGGAIYFAGGNTDNPSITIDTCKFTGNSGGALYCGTKSQININNNFDTNSKNIFQGNLTSGWGGAILIESNCSVDIHNASFISNTASYDGGAIKSYSDVTIGNCAFSDNEATGFSGYAGYGYGGAIDVYSGSDIQIIMNNCNFAGNKSIWGGALSCEKFNATLTNCFFINNEAEEGGAIDAGFGTLNIDSAVLRLNIAIAGDAGAINCRSTTARIENSEFFDNSAEASYAWGGAINFYGTPDQINQKNVKNCLFAGNNAGFNGGAIACSSGVNPWILNSTFNDNIADVFGGAIFVNWDAGAEISDCIFSKNNGHAIHEVDFGGNAIAEYCLFYNNPEGHYYDSSTMLVYGDVAQIPGGVSNLDGNPRFLTGPLGDYYLNQDTSPAIDSGHDLASNLNLDTRTTSIDDSNDTGQVDIGYHFRKLADTPTYELTTGVAGGQGTISPGGTFLAGTIVTITAYPQSGWLVSQWTGTEDDSQTDLTATVVMNSDRNVTVEFYTPRIIYVGGDSGYPTIQAAIDNAQEGDIIQIMPSSQPYYTQAGFDINDWNITITSSDPNDPCVVAATVIEQEVGPDAGVSRAFTISNVGPLTRLQGITIRNFFVRGLDGLDGDPTRGYYDGRNGNTVGGIGILCNNASPIFENCVLENCNVTGGDGGDGAGGDQDHPDGGNGGWGGAAVGGAVACTNNSNPVFKNCTFSNNSVNGGNGGDGGNGIEDPYGLAGRGGSWYYGYILPSPWELGFPIDAIPKDYSGGLGGAVFVDIGCAPTFENCTFVNNTSSSGTNGICGQNGPPDQLRPEPAIRYRIDNVGGAVYVTAGATAEFKSCTFTSNTADPNEEPDGSNDSLLGFGGAIGAEYGGSVIINDCTFSNNSSDIGSGIYSDSSYSNINNSSFTGNIAYHGGAMLLSGGATTIINSTFTTNEANQPGSFGGAIALLAADAEIIDSNLTANASSGSGGGIYVSSQGIDGIEIPSGNSVLLWNCLITGNLATFHGGGVAAVWNAGLDIANCTIANNTAGGLGGGLYVSYQSYVDVIDSIIWGNLASKGIQVGVGDEQGPSAVDISYSDIGPRMGFAQFAPEPAGTEQIGGATLIESQTIYNQLSSTAWAEVIVSLYEPAALRASTNWHSPISVEILRNALSSRRSSVLATLSSSDFQVDYEYENQAGFAGKVSQTGLNKLLTNPLVQYVEPVRYVCICMAQALALANALEARQTYNGSGIAIAIVDSGIDYTHPRLGGGSFPNNKVIGGRDTGENDADPRPGSSAHGTCVAGIAAGGLGTVGDYIGGVAPAAKLYALKISDANDDISNAATLAAWDWCITHQYDNSSNPILVINNSWGGSVPFDDPVQADELFPAHALAAETAEAAGITILASSGNDGFAGEGISWPAAMSKVISVGAVYDVTDQVTEYSNTAANLDILAPADPIYTTDIVGVGGYAAGDYFPSFNGTSAACPFAAGAVADIQSAAMSELGYYLTPGQIRTLLTLSGNPVTDTKVDITKPRVNLGKAIAGLKGSAIFVAPGSSLTGWDMNTVEPDMWDPDYTIYRNITEDPLFVGGYRLSHVDAGQDFNSPCVDSGSDLSVNLGFALLTTRTDRAPDRGIVDMGYHAEALDSCRFSDLVKDGIINFNDFAIVAMSWLDYECETTNSWCNGADITTDTVVDFNDLTLVTDCWLEEDNDEPTPNPSQWAIEPYAESSTSVSMSAVPSVDLSWGLRVEYEFVCESGDCHSSDWQSEPNYTDVDLATDTEFSYKVRARDTRGNATEFSVVRFVTTTVGQGSDTTAPTPNPMTWAVTPFANTDTSITMTATTATDNSGGLVQYQFDETTGSPGGTDSDWQNDPGYTDTGLDPAGQYCYRVRARDQFGNITDWSPEICVTNLGDPNPPTPAPTFIISPDVNYVVADSTTLSGQFQFMIYPVDYRWWHKIVVDTSGITDDVTATENLEVRFICTSNSSFSSTNKVPVPITLGMGDGVIGSRDDMWRVTVAGDIIIYDVDVNTYAATGRTLKWRVCVYDEAGNSVCTGIHTIGPPQ